MNTEADDVLVDHPAFATAVVAVLATVAYVGVQVVLGGTIAPLETAVFVGVFTAVYVFGNRYLREWTDPDGNDEGISTDADPESE